MKKSLFRGLVMAAFAAFAALTGGSALAQANCSQYASWQDAQAAHQANPWLGLDPDGNGVACDCLANGFPC